MAKTNKKHQEEQKTAVENMSENLTNASQKIAEHKKAVGLIIAGIVVVAVLVFGFIFFRNRSNVTSAQKFAKVEQTAYQNTMKSKNPSDSLFIANQIKEYEKVVKEEGGKDGGNQARIMLSSLYYEQGQYQKALDNIKEAKFNEPLLKANGLALEGDCYVNLKKYGDALNSFDAALKAAEEYPEVAVRILFKKALVFDAQKKYADALKVYEQIEKEYPQEAQAYAQKSSQAGPDGVFTVDAYIAREKARLGK